MKLRCLYTTRRIELSKIHSNLSSRYARYRIKGKESFPGKLSRETSPPGPNFLSSTSTKLGARFLRGKKNTRADIYRNPSVLTFEWSSNRVLGQRTRVSSAPRNSFIEKGVFSPWLTCRTRKEEERMRERERGGVQAGYRKLLLFYQPRSQRGKPEVMALRSPSGIETAAA